METLKCCSDPIAPLPPALLGLPITPRSFPGLTLLSSVPVSGRCTRAREGPGDPRHTGRKQIWNPGLRPPGSFLVVLSLPSLFDENIIAVCPALSPCWAPCYILYLLDISLHEAGRSGPVHWDNPEGWVGEGGWEGDSGWGHMYTCG